MDASAAGPQASSPNAAGRRHDDAAVPGLPYGPGWIVLRDCPLGGGGSPVDLALLHPKIGVALVAFADAGADAPERLRRALDARRFPAIFGGYPPIVRAVVPADRLADLGHILSARFRAQPPASLEGGDAWVPTARAALEAGPAADDSAAAGAQDEPVASWWMTLLVLASAVSIGVLAAVAVIPAPLDPGGMPAGPRTTAVVAPPKRGDAPAAGAPSKPPPAAPERAAAPDAIATRRPPPPAAAERGAAAPETAVGSPPPQAAAEPGSAPEAVVFRPAPTPDTAGGADAAVRRDEGASGPPPVVAADGTRAEPPPPAPAAHLAAADPAPEPPPPAPFLAAAAAVPEQPGAIGEAEPRARVAAAAAGSARATAAVAPARGAASAAAPRAAPAAEPYGGERCRAILVRTTLGEGLSYEDKEHLRRRCQRPPRD